MSDPLEDQLIAQRPVPPPTFRGELRRRLVARRPGGHRPANLWTRVAVSMGCGIVMLALAVALV